MQKRFDIGAIDTEANISSENVCVVNHVKEDTPKSMTVMHHHPYYELYLIVSGQRKYFFNDKILILNPANAILIKPNEPHRAIPSKNIAYERYAVYVEATFMSKLLKYNSGIKQLFKKGVISLTEESFEEIIRIVKCIDAETENQSELHQNSIRNHLERIMLNMSFEKNRTQAEKIQMKNDVRLQAALDYITANYNKKITLEECAKKSFMSKSNFTRVFHKVLGINLKEYINTLRVKKATQLLVETDMSISEIAYEIGYDSLSHFGMIFKGMMGAPPKEYRKQNRQQTKT